MGVGGLACTAVCKGWRGPCPQNKKGRRRTLSTEEKSLRLQLIKRGKGAESAVCKGQRETHSTE